METMNVKNSLSDRDSKVVAKQVLSFLLKKEVTVNSD